MSGYSTRVWRSTKAPSTATPTTMQAHVRGSSQPQALDCCSPSTDSPIPAAISTAPAQSIGAGRRSSGIFARAVRISAMIATGTFTQKIARQVHSVR